MERSVEATEKAAIAAQNTATALPILERPYVFLRIEATNFKESLNDFAEKARHEGFNKRTDFAASMHVVYRFVNYGKTPAIIESAHVMLQIAPTIPLDFATKYISPAPIPTDFVIEGNGGMFPTSDNLGSFRYLGDNITLEWGQLLRSGRTFLWFYGAVIYFDIFGGHHETRFVWRYNGLLPLFATYGGAQYNRRT